MLMTRVCPQSTAESAVSPALTPVAVAVGQVLFEQQLQALEEEVASLQPVEPRSPLAPFWGRYFLRAVDLRSY